MMACHLCVGVTVIVVTSSVHTPKRPLPCAYALPQHDAAAANPVNASICLRELMMGAASLVARPSMFLRCALRFFFCCDPVFREHLCGSMLPLNTTAVCFTPPLGSNLQDLECWLPGNEYCKVCMPSDGSASPWGCSNTAALLL